MQIQKHKHGNSNSAPLPTQKNGQRFTPFRAALSDLSSRALCAG